MRWPPCGRAPLTSRGRSTGYGERCGNANLISIIPNLQLKLGYDASPTPSSRRWTPTAHYVAELLNFTPIPTRRMWGATRSRTRAACTSPASCADPSTFEHIAPEIVGIAARCLISSCRQGDRRVARPRRR